LLANKALLYHLDLYYKITSIIPKWLYKVYDNQCLALTVSWRF